jgi:Uma2 family endonuclease
MGAITFGMHSAANPKLKPITTSTERVLEPIWRLSVPQYHSMIANGILEEDAQLELLEGLLIAKMTKNPRHRLSTGLLQDALLSLLPVNYHLNLQEPITLQDSEPEPDLAVICGQRLDYRDRHPDAASLEIVVEVADTSLERDSYGCGSRRTIKQRIYARAGIPIYWILNLGDRQLEIYTQPNQEESIYKECQILSATESVGVSLRGKEVVIGFICVGNLL